MDVESPENPEQESTKQPALKRDRNDTVNDSEQADASESPQVPPDGGLRAYIIVIASFFTNGLIFGIINSYSVVYIVLLKQLQSQNVEGAEVKACKYITSVYFLLVCSTLFCISKMFSLLSK